MSANQPIPDEPSVGPAVPVSEALAPRLPRLPHVNEAKFINEAKFAPHPVIASAVDGGDDVFADLVEGEADIIGLLAYALHKQNERDWLASFQRAHGRPPEAAETTAYLLGERLPRRAATYRRVAQDMLSAATRQSDASSSPLMRPANDAEGMLQPAAVASNTLVGKPLADKTPVGKVIGQNAAALRTIGGLLLLVIVMAVVFRLAGTWLFGTPGR